VDITAVVDFLGLCDQKSSYKHVSDFGRLRSYGHKQLVQFTTEWQPVLRSAVAFSKTSFKHRSIQIKGNFTKL